MSGFVEFIRRLTTGMEGAEELLSALAAGDVAGFTLWRRRLREGCARCESRVTLTIGRMRTPGDFCGPPLVDRMDQAKPTCGCSCALMAAVKSKRCPQEHWEE